MAKKPLLPVPQLRGGKLVVPRFDEETGRVVYEVLLPKPKPSPPKDTARRAMIVAIVRRDFRGRRPLPSIAAIHRHIRANHDLVWKDECARQKPPVTLGAPGRDMIAYTLKDAGLLKPKPRAKPLSK